MMNTPRMLLLLRIAYAAALTIVMVLALLPVDDKPTLFSWQDKVEHLFVFTLLTLLGAAAWPGRLMGVVLGLMAYGAAMEIAQSETAYRMGDIRDWMADVLGIAIAAGALAWRARKRVGSGRKH